MKWFGLATKHSAEITAARASAGLEGAFNDIKGISEIKGCHRHKVNKNATVLNEFTRMHIKN